jgi:hypothetical protein
MLSIAAWTAAGAALGVACECAAWNSWRVVCGSVVTGLAGARDWPGLVTGSFLFVIFSRFRVVGLTGGSRVRARPLLRTHVNMFPCVLRA